MMCNNDKTVHVLIALKCAHQVNVTVVSIVCTIVYIYLNIQVEYKSYFYTIFLLYFFSLAIRLMWIFFVPPKIYCAPVFGMIFHVKLNKREKKQHWSVVRFGLCHCRWFCSILFFPNEVWIMLLFIYLCVLFNYIVFNFRFSIQFGYASNAFDQRFQHIYSKRLMVVYFIFCILLRDHLNFFFCFFFAWERA